MMEEYIQVFTATEKRDDAEKIAKTLAEKRLAGCIQMSDLVVSTYWWKGSVMSRGRVVSLIIR